MHMNNSKSQNEIEELRIRKIYNERDKKKEIYNWYKSDVQQQYWERRNEFIKFFNINFGKELSDLKILDLGCGDGGIIRTLIEFGVNPENITGLELLESRIDEAKKKSSSHIKWFIGDLEKLPQEYGNYDLIILCTVFSSILNDSLRFSLAKKIWDRLNNDGRILVFDFRYNNPLNKDVKRVSLHELKNYWPSNDFYYRKLWCIPPFSRYISCISQILPYILCNLIPILKSHFIFSVKK